MNFSIVPRWTRTLLLSALRQHPMKMCVFKVGFASEESNKVVIANDGKTVVCWHPEPEFPYEHTLPMPEINVPHKNVIKALDENDTFKGLKEEFVREKLMKMTFTTKHRWFPNSRKFKARKIPMERPYL